MQQSTRLYMPSVGLMVISKCMILSVPSGKLMVMCFGRFSSDKSAVERCKQQGVHNDVV